MGAEEEEGKVEGGGGGGGGEKKVCDFSGRLVCFVTDDNCGEMTFRNNSI